MSPQHNFYNFYGNYQLHGSIAMTQIPSLQPFELSFKWDQRLYYMESEH
jgi:hypothetical protein